MMWLVLGLIAVLAMTWWMKHFSPTEEIKPQNFWRHLKNNDVKSVVVIRHQGRFGLRRGPLPEQSLEVLGSLATSSQLEQKCCCSLSQTRKSLDAGECFQRCALEQPTDKQVPLEIIGEATSSTADQLGQSRERDRR